MPTKNTTPTRPIRRSGRKPEQIPGRPYCMACRRALNKARSYTNSDSQHVPRWQCRTCKYSIMGISSNYWIRLNYSAPALLLLKEDESPEIAPHELLSVIDTALCSARLPMDLREDMRSEVALAVLTRSESTGQRITRASLDLKPSTIRAIVRPILRSQPNRFKFVSLEHCYQEGGRRLEERLAG